MANRRSILMSSAAVTLPASRDCYLYYDLLGGGIITKDVALGGAAPSTLAHEAFLGKVVTGAATITSISTTGRKTVPFKSIVSIESRTLDDVQDGSTWRRVTDVSAGNQVVAASIATSAVTTPKVANNAIGPNRLALNQSHRGISRNAAFAIYEDG